MDFLNIEYLKSGTPSQKSAYSLILKYHLWEILAEYKPVLVGTIPIDIDIPSSDLDIICESHQIDEFEKFLRRSFEKENGFELKQKELRGIQSVICRFFLDNKPFEIVGQHMEPIKQVAFRHMIIEYEILKKKGEPFKQKIIKLKNEGYKTEPAFAKLLGIIGDPYLELLSYKD